MLSIDTHFYDGQLIGIGSLLNSYFANRYNPAREKDYFELCRQQLTHPMAISVLNILEDNHFNSPGGPNFDPKNQMDAGKLICFCGICIELGHQIGLILETQLIEMLGGFCPQGRTTRLIQVLMVFIDLNDPPLETLETPGASGTLEISEVSGTVETLGTSETPGTSEIPGTLETLETLETPGTVETLETPGTSETLGTIETLETPGTSETPKTSETPGTSETSGAIETLETPKTSETPETSETPGTSETPETLKISETLETHETLRTPENPGTLEILETHEKSEILETPEAN